MRTQRIALHFTNTKTALIGAPARRLMCPNLPPPRRTAVHLIVGQMFETHEIQRTHEDIRFELGTCYPRIHDIVSRPMASQRLQHIAQLRDELTTITKCRGIELRRHLYTDAPSHHLHELRHCHA